MNRPCLPVPYDQICHRKLIDLKIICTNTHLKTCQGGLENWNPKLLQFSLFFPKGLLGLFTSPLFPYIRYKSILPSVFPFLKGFVVFLLLFTDTFISLAEGNKPCLSPSLWFYFSFPLLFYEDGKVDAEEVCHSSP